MQRESSAGNKNLKQLRRKLAATGLCLASTAAVLLMATNARYVTPAMRGETQFTPAYFNTVLLGDLAEGQSSVGTGIQTVTAQDGTVTQLITGQKLTSSLKLSTKNAFGTASAVYTQKEGEGEGEGAWVPKADLNGAAPGDEFRMTFTIANGTTVRGADGSVDPANDTAGRNIEANQAETDIRYTLSIITTNNLPLTYSLLDLDNNIEYTLKGEKRIYDELGGMCTVYTVSGVKNDQQSTLANADKTNADKIFDREGARILPWLGENTITFHRYQLIAQWDQNDDRYNAYAYDSSGKLIEKWVDATEAVSTDGISNETYAEGEEKNKLVYRYVRNAAGEYTFKDGEDKEYKHNNETIKKNMAENADYYKGWTILTYQAQIVPGNSAMYMKEIENIEVRVEVESFVRAAKATETETYISTGHIILGEDGKGTLSMEQFVNSEDLAAKADILAARTVSYGAFGNALPVPANLADKTEGLTAEETLLQGLGTEKLYRYSFDVANGTVESVVWMPGATAGAGGEAQGEGQQGGANQEPAEGNAIPVLEDKTGAYKRTYTFSGDANGAYAPLNVALAVPVGGAGVGSDCLTDRKYYIVTADGTRYDAVTNGSAPENESWLQSLKKALVHLYKRVKNSDGSYNYEGTNPPGWAVVTFVKHGDPDNTSLTTAAFTQSIYGCQSFTLYMQCAESVYTPHSPGCPEKASDSRDEFKLYFYTDDALNTPEGD